jgi:hypothetical protein
MCSGSQKQIISGEKIKEEDLKIAEMKGNTKVEITRKK